MPFYKKSASEWISELHSSQGTNAQAYQYRARNTICGTMSCDQRSTYLFIEMLLAQPSKSMFQCWDKHDGRIFKSRLSRHDRWIAQDRQVDRSLLEPVTSYYSSGWWKTRKGFNLDFFEFNSARDSSLFPSITARRGDYVEFLIVDADPLGQEDWFLRNISNTLARALQYSKDCL